MVELKGAKHEIFVAKLFYLQNPSLYRELTQLVDKNMKKIIMVWA
jgi:hypothetical protein